VKKEILWITENVFGRDTTKETETQQLSVLISENKLLKNSTRLETAPPNFDR
jgi:hypothetical protein